MKNQGSLCEQTLQLFALLECGELDAAITAGLVQFVHTQCTYCSKAHLARITAAQQQLQSAWEARARYEARQTRLERRVRTRALSRPSHSDGTSSKEACPPALPPAITAALARAKAKAAGHTK